MQQAKHKKSKAKQDRVQKKLDKAANVEMSTEETAIPKSQEEKDSDRAARKKLNAHKTAYKRKMQNFSDRKGPRAYGKL